MLGANWWYVFVAPNSFLSFSLSLFCQNNAQELQATKLEMELFLESDEANYTLFLEGVTNKQRMKAEELAPKPTTSVVVGQPSNTILSKTVDTAREEKEVSAKKGLEAIAEQQSKMDATAKSTKELVASSSLSPGLKPSKTSSPSKVSNRSIDVDSFMPNDNGVIDHFLESGGEEPKSSESVKVDGGDTDSDDDNDEINPMVMTVKDDYDHDADIETSAKNSVRNQVYSARSSSDNETTMSDDDNGNNGSKSQYWWRGGGSHIHWKWSGGEEETHEVEERQETKEQKEWGAAEKWSGGVLEPQLEMKTTSMHLQTTKNSENLLFQTISIFFIYNPYKIYLYYCDSLRTNSSWSNGDGESGVKVMKKILLLLLHCSSLGKEENTL